MTSLQTILLIHIIALIIIFMVAYRTTKIRNGNRREFWMIAQLGFLPIVSVALGAMFLGIAVVVYFDKKTKK